jgi:ubiquitin carboxyl-terminal hydrolase 2/21
MFAFNDSRHTEIRRNNIVDNNNINGNIIKEIGYIAAMIDEEPKIGLDNIGATCYMNATLQCFSHTIKLANFFLDPTHEAFLTSPEKKFSKYFLEVIKKLWIKEYNNNKKSYSPYDFKNLISEMNPLFEGIAANDSKDLVNFILQQLHSELNQKKENNIINNYYIGANQNDEKNMLNSYLVDFQKKHCSIISDIFFGTLETVTECLNCKQRNLMNGINNPLYLYNFQIFNFIIFPLEEIRKLKSQSNNNYYNEVDIYDCFDYHERQELMQGDNAMWCKYCKQNAPAYYTTRIYSPSQYLVLILNRGKGNIFNVKLNFSEIIDITKYIHINQNGHYSYHLYALVTHIGPSSMSGHFIAFCKSPIDGMWYKYNDSQVNLIGDFYKDIHEFGCPYILFYENN